MTDDAAVRAAAEAIHEATDSGSPICLHCRRQAEIAVEAARPVIEAEVWEAARTAYRASRAAVRTEPEQ